jgi:predicted DNA-binding transcriptional regulator AlpA
MKPNGKNGEHGLAGQVAGTLQLLPRLIRMRDAPGYLGMDRNKFNAQVRPLLTEIPLGAQSIAFDRLELDAWASQYIARNGRPGRSSNGGSEWDAKNHRVSSSGATSGSMSLV